MRTLDVGWDTCAASLECAGSARQPYGRCLAHLDAAELDEVVRGLSPGSAIDLRATVVGQDLLERILSATRGRLGRARFDWATFPESVRFCDIVFGGDVSFDHARFQRLASFFNARFTRNVSFREVRFDRELSLHGVTITGHAAFDRVSIDGDALFGGALFDRTASFEQADFHGFVTFDGTGFTGDATLRGCRFRRTVSFRRTSFGGLAGFDGARFSAGGYLAPISVGRHLTLAGAWAGKGLDVTTGGCSVDLRRLEVGGRLTVRLDNARADLEGATLRGPATVRGRDGARVTSLHEVDAEQLELSDLDLSTCLFTGIRHPEGLRLSGCALAVVPRRPWPRLRWWPLRRAPNHG
ncbi:pentapeptide repeat-containing protein [Streptosporangium amethystogenes]|uniref:pentapeptide repeat-containing protein n=1 Tax=Streptosporangium amethystogenes TaxID=2002 RepID=UPI0009FFB81E|nr:pentapeptide repeat-containing protein [Streptosporangium amethystogenes]